MLITWKITGKKVGKNVRSSMVRVGTSFDIRRPAFGNNFRASGRRPGFFFPFFSLHRASNTLVGATFFSRGMQTARDIMKARIGEFDVEKYFL